MHKKRLDLPILRDVEKTFEGSEQQVDGCDYQDYYQQWMETVRVLVGSM